MSAIIGRQMGFRLVVAARVDMTLQGEHQRHRVLGDGHLVHHLCAREPHALRRKRAWSYWLMPALIDCTKRSFGA